MQNTEADQRVPNHKLVLFLAHYEKDATKCSKDALELGLYVHDQAEVGSNSLLNLFLEIHRSKHRFHSGPGIVWQFSEIQVPVIRLLYI